MKTDHLKYFNLEFNTGNNNLPHTAYFHFIIDGKSTYEITCCITSRYAGDMALQSERSKLYDSLGIHDRKIYSVRQIHSKIVYAVDADNPPGGDGDGMVSSDGNVVLSVYVADCLPVYLYDTQSRAFGIVHSGWKGTGIVTVAVKMMKEKWQCNPENIAAILGPCIDSCCYNVDKERYDNFEMKFSAESVKKTLSTDGNISGQISPEIKYFLDLKKANIGLLQKAGIRNIAVCDNCTFTDDRLASYRMEGPENFTHMAAIIGKF